jgi:hypothetical protein
MLGFVANGITKLKLVKDNNKDKTLCLAGKYWLTNYAVLPTWLYGSEYWTIKARDATRITAAEMKYTRRTVG